MTDSEHRLMQRRRLLADRGKIIFEWMREMGARYKEKGVFPLSLADYYTEKEDVEVAAIVECLVPNPLDDKSARRLGYITELHNILGDTPSLMISERNFLHLLPQGGRDGLLGRMGVQKAYLFNLLDWIWYVWHIKAPLEVAFLEYAGLRWADGQIPDLHGQIGQDLSSCAVRMALMRLCLADGIGRGIWQSVHGEDLACPLDAEVKRMLRQLYPVGMFRDEDADEVISYLGWDAPCEFVYSYLACREFEREMAEIGARLRGVVDGKVGITTWHKSYKDGLLFTPEYSGMLAMERERVRTKIAETRATRKKNSIKNQFVK